MWWCLSTSVSLTTCLLRPRPSLSQSTLSLKYSYCVVCVVSLIVDSRLFFWFCLKKLSDISSWWVVKKG